ncbi:complex I subunit 4 family protein [Desulfovermiculus halophilus]|jgi:NADH-quinone oxidoreductase subunit M|uniref:complex I subunit 4 family protein n=1 Tax=Desulfovermiculus halophilus TaxID=339722 RepID=UPI000AA58DF4|nr:NADH-quinone oxidoreductase subunit M [Desulfovermiculus halophilus]
MLTSGFPLLSTLIFFPLLGAGILFFLRSDTAVRVFTLAVGLIECLLAVPMAVGFDTSTARFQMVEKAEWIQSWNISYFLGIDGISVLMVLLSVFLLPICVLCSWKYIGRRVKEFHFCLLLMTTACIGVFTSLDFVLFYIFWEAMLVPMYLLIAVWGGPKRRYASLKFFIYTLAGSTLFLAAIVALFINTGTFSIPELMEHSYSFRFQFWTFLAMALAFAIKVPMYPFHTWLPAAHVEAPTAGSVLLASILLKMGAYGFLRFCLPITPAASHFFAPLMIGMGILSIIVGSLLALGQSDMKKLIAYSSVAHMGFVTLGIFVFAFRGVEGAIMHMLNHGIITGALFLLVGLIYERSHSRELAENLGVSRYLPSFTGFLLLFSMAAFGFPGTNGFFSKLLVLLGVFEVSTPVGVVFIVGLLLGLAYLLRLLLNVGWGTPTKAAAWKDMSFREWVYLVPLGVLVIYLGVAPGKALSFLGPSIDNLLDNFQAQKELRIETASTPSAQFRAQDGAYLPLSFAGEDTRPIGQHMHAASLHLPSFQDAEPDVRRVAWLPERTSSIPAPVRMSEE